MRKGFTLVEVLATIIILGILSVLLVPAVTESIEKSKNRSYEVLEKSILDSAKLYMAEHASEYPTIDTPGEIINITLNDIVADGFLDDPVIDPRTDEAIPLGTNIVVEVIAEGNISVEFNY